MYFLPEFNLNRWFSYRKLRFPIGFWNPMGVWLISYRNLNSYRKFFYFGKKNSKYLGKSFFMWENIWIIFFNSISHLTGEIYELCSNLTTEIKYANVTTVLDNFPGAMIAFKWMISSKFLVKYRVASKIQSLKLCFL